MGEVSNFLKKAYTPTVLIDPFHTQQQLIDHQSLHGPSSSTIDEFKMNSSETIDLNTRSKCYEPPIENKTDDVPSEKPSVAIPPLSNGIHIEKNILDAILHPPNSTPRKSILNPNARAS